MNSIYMKISGLNEKLMCDECVGFGTELRMEYGGPLKTYNEVECSACDGTGLYFEFEEEMHLTMFFKLLNLFNNSINMYEEDDRPFTEDDHGRIVYEAANILQLVPAASVVPCIDNGFSLFALENHGIVFSPTEILAVF